jgi:DNA-binding YbaB/EbfC family protein
MFNKGQIAGLMKQAQAMQAKIQKAQEELSTTAVTGEAASGKVKITITCKYQVQRVFIDSTLMSGDVEDKEMLEDLLAVAINHATTQIETITTEKMNATGAGNIPGMGSGGMKLPF